MSDLQAGARQQECASYSEFREAFGGLQNALKAARLPLNYNQEFTEQELIAQLQDLSRALGRPITTKDVVKAGKAGTCARLETFKRKFGSAGKAFQKAGVSSQRRFTGAALVLQYRALAKELGRIPKMKDIHKAASLGKCAGYDAFKKVGGGLQPIRRDAGLLRGAMQRYTREQLLEQLKSLTKKLGRTPKAFDIRKGSRLGECAGVKTFRVYFGGHNKALREAGLEITKPSPYSRAQLIHLLQKLARELGHRPSQTDINKASARGACASGKTYISYFGSITGAQRAARLESVIGKTKATQPSTSPKIYTRDQIQRQLEQLASKLGRRPTRVDVVAACRRRECAGLTAIASFFGDFTTAIRSIGFEVKDVRKRSHIQLIEQLRELTHLLRRIPTAQDIVNAQGRCATPATFIRQFGSIVEARKAAALEDILAGMQDVGKMPRVSEKFERSALIANLRSLALRLKKAPSRDDIRRACRDYGTAGVKAYVREFGGIPAARKAAKIED